ncbi:MAG: hypothetical protein ORN58_03160, partial [Sediminibacterium sp.]|nr:hypothetical protein [Sediminibacterium sp.]
FLTQSYNLNKFNSSLLNFIKKNKDCNFHLIGKADILTNIKKNHKIQVHSNIQSFQTILI